VLPLEFEDYVNFNFLTTFLDKGESLQRSLFDESVRAVGESDPTVTKQVLLC